MPVEVARGNLRNELLPVMPLGRVQVAGKQGRVKAEEKSEQHVTKVLKMKCLLLELPSKHGLYLMFCTSEACIITHTKVQFVKRFVF